MKTVTIQAFDRNGTEIDEGDIIQSEYGVTTVVQFNEKKRCFQP